MLRMPHLQSLRSLRRTLRILHPVWRLLKQKSSHQLGAFSDSSGGESGIRTRGRV